MKRKAYYLIIAASLSLLPFEACLAYVGPGAGITLLGALGAVLLAIVFAIGGLLIWPFRAMRRRRAQSGDVESPLESSDEPSSIDITGESETMVQRDSATDTRETAERPSD